MTPSTARSLRLRHAWCLAIALLLPVLAHTRRVVAPDLLGFGYTERPTDPANPPEGTQYRMEVWVRQATFAPCRITR